MNQEWYKDFFSGIALDFWRKAVAEYSADEAAYVKKILGVRKGAKLLDVPCGDGRHAKLLAKQGFHVTGVDFADENIRDAKKSALKQKLKIEYLKKDKRELAWENEFDGAYCLGNSFGYLDDEGMQKFVNGVAKSLKPKAKFVIDTAMVAEAIIPNLDTSWWMKSDDITVLIANHYIASESVLKIELTFLKNNKSETREIFHRVYSIAELKKMLSNAGLQTIALHSNTKGDLFKLGDPQLWITAEKTEMKLKRK